LFRMCHFVQNVPLCLECANVQVLEEAREKVLDLYTGNTTLFLFFTKITTEDALSAYLSYKKIAAAKEFVYV
jgi:hypothetical protein